MQPAGNAGGAGQVPPVGGAAAPENLDPRRPRPENQPMTEFLLQIGRENMPAPQDENRRYVQDEQLQVEEALRLGDITQVGTTQAFPEEEDPMWRGGLPIYQFAGPAGDDIVKFSLDPRSGGAVWGNPPVIEHVPGQVHDGMHQALWAAYCYDHVGEEGITTNDNYFGILRGIMWRYAGQGNQPQFR